MMKIIKIFVTVLLIVVITYYALGYFSSFFGWYIVQNLEDRKHSLTIQEAVSRGTFVRKINFQADSQIDFSNFEPFIERGFKWGRHSSKDTRSLNNENFPYQLSFNYRPSNETTITIKENYLTKFDSSDASWGFLKDDKLPDTILLEVNKNGKRNGIIRVW